MSRFEKWLMIFLAALVFSIAFITRIGRPEGVPLDDPETMTRVSLACASSLIILGLVFFALVLLFLYRNREKEIRPEKDGNYYSYKVLRFDPDEREYYSPRGDLWKNGMLVADTIPEVENESGIYSALSPHDPAIAYYMDELPDAHVVKIMNIGKIFVYEDGLRSQAARIVKDLTIKKGR